MSYQGSLRIKDNKIMFMEYRVIGEIINNIAHVDPMYHCGEVSDGLDHNGFSESNKNLVWTKKPETANKL
ncbi:MAG: hypothetical protein WC725_04870 [Patescibacteria group bacterium]|jgi:hypothetical protein